MSKESAHLDAQTILKRRRYEELMQAGRKAFKDGNRRLAHDMWREAATLDPYDEQVWLMLFRVLDTDEDRIACLENIIAINPMNVQARRRLRAYHEVDIPEPVLAPQLESNPAKKTKARASARKPQKQKAAQSRRKVSAQKPRRQVWVSVVIVVLAIVLGLLVAVAASTLFAPG